MHEANLRIAFICLVAFVRTWICINFHSVLINEYWVAVVSPAVSLLFFFFLLFEFIDERWFYAQRACNLYEKDFAAEHNVTIQEKNQNSRATFADHVRTFAGNVRTFTGHVRTFAGTFSCSYVLQCGIWMRIQDKNKKKKKNAYNVQFSWNLITGYQT